MPTIEERLAALEIAKATREVQYEFIIDSLEEIKRILNNGITTDVHDLKLWREQHQRDNETHTTDWKQILFPVVSQIITSVITIIAILAALHIPPFK